MKALRQESMCRAPGEVSVSARLMLGGVSKSKERIPMESCITCPYHHGLPPIILVSYLVL